jgi:hypothetical protein
MEEEDYFRDQRRRDRGSNFVGSYRRPGSSEFFNPAGDILAGIESAESSIGKRKKTVRDFENAAAIRKQEMIAGIENTEGMSDISAIDSIQAGLMAQVDELHRLDIASFEGDRSAYLKKSNEVNKVVQEIPALMGLIDAAGTTLEEAIMSGKGLDKSVLKSNKQDYYNFVDDARQGGKNISFKIENGNIIAQLDGKDVFNGSAYIKSKEKGFDLINYVKDYSKEMTAIDAEASKNLTSLISASDIETINKSGLSSTTIQKNDYIEALNAYKSALERNIGIEALTNESTFQTYVSSKDQYTASPNQNEQTKKAIINEMVKNKFPMYDPDTDKAFGDIKVTRRIIKGSGEGKEEKVTLADYSDIYNASNSVVNNFKKVKEIIPTQPYQPLSTIESLLTTNSNNLNEKQRQVKSEIQKSIKEAQEWASKYVGRNIKIGKQSPGQISKPEIKVTEKGIKMVVNYGKDQQVIYNLSDPNQIKTFENNLVGQDKGITLNSNNGAVLD